ncbi:MAG: endolytic transglycosylase MltG [Chlorobi bacterium]|nr:endolytic transglycosylase MltG [Chlorobiota bacterium]
MEYYHSKYSRPRKKKKNRFRKFLFWFFFLLILAAAGAGYYLYQVVYKPNVWTPEGKEVSVYIPTNSDFEDVKLILYKNGLIVHRRHFEWLAEKKKYPKRVLPGRYIVKDGMNNNDLINMLRSGKQVPVKVTFNNVRDVFQLAGIVGKQIEADSADIAGLLTDTVYLKQIGYTKETIPAAFIPNTYEFYWNTDAKGFIDRMLEEHDKFWNEERKAKARELGMTPVEVVTLASIVEKETNKNDEKPMIAGVYLNRLKYEWRLQADPTVVYAIGDYNIRRVLNVHKEVDSPYNTYKHLGLPPGPICIPSISSIDAVLDYDRNKYFFFCAKDDLSGYHVFAKTNAQHRKNAKKYQEALNKMRIYK